MLLSLVVQIKPLKYSSIPAWQGRALYDIFLNEWVRPVDSSLASDIHNGREVKPFCVSNLHARSNHNGDNLALQPDQSLWFRITTFDPALSKVVQEGLLPQWTSLPAAPQNLKLADIPFELCSVSLEREQHAWAGKLSYSDLAQGRLLGTHVPDTLQLEFSSPTAIKSNGQHLIFPQPEQLVGHWLDKWNKFAPLSLPAETRDFAANCIAVSRYRLETQAAHYGETTFIGFTGRCTWRILNRDPYWSRIIYNLAAFAFYCGTGHHTTIGLGQTRLYNELDQPHS